VAGVIPLLFFGLSLSLADLPRLQRWLGALLRSLLVVALALALARVARTTDATKVSTIFLVDVSDSATDASLAAARAALADAWAARGDDDVQLVTFASDARVVPLGRDAADVPAELARHEQGAGSNLEAALQLAYGLFP